MDGLFGVEFVANSLHGATHSCQCSAERDFKFVGDRLECFVLVDPHLHNDSIMFGQQLDRLSDFNGCFGQDHFVDCIGVK